MKPNLSMNCAHIGVWGKTSRSECRGVPSEARPSLIYKTKQGDSLEQPCLQLLTQFSNVMKKNIHYFSLSCSQMMSQKPTRIPAMMSHATQLPSGGLVIAVVSRLEAVFASIERWAPTLSTR